MKALHDKSPPQAVGDLQNLWYVPDRRIRTKAATDKATEIAKWITGSRETGIEPDEHTLFVCLHTCAYRAKHRSRTKQVMGAAQIEWIRRWQQIRGYIVEKNLGLVYSMIGRFGSGKLDEDDLLSEAMLALTQAANRFNPWKGYRFSTYACNVIARALVRRGKREWRYRQLFPVAFDMSFERPERAPDFQAELYVERLRYALQRNLGELTTLESGVMAKRYPGNGDARMTFREIGDSIGLSKERVRQIQNNALRKLRDVLDADPVLQ